MTDKYTQRTCSVCNGIGKITYYVESPDEYNVVPISAMCECCKGEGVIDTEDEPYS